MNKIDESLEQKNSKSNLKDSINSDKNLADKVDLVTKIWTEQQQLIEAADAKANFNLVICATLLAGFMVLSGNALPLIKSEIINYREILLIIGTFSFILIIFSFLSALIVVFPRFDNDFSKINPKPFPYFHYIAKKIDSPEDLYKLILMHDDQDLLKIRLYQAYELAKIVNKKMIWVKRSVILTFISVFNTATFFVFFVLFEILA